MADPNADPKEDLIKAPFFAKGIHYSVTINPDDSHQFFGKPERFRKFRNVMYELFISLSQQHIDYKFVIELSEPRNNKYGSGPRYHVHGWILFKSTHSIFQFLDIVYYNWTRLGHVDIDTVQDMTVWNNYMTKQSHIFKHVNPVLSNITEDNIKE